MRHLARGICHRAVATSYVSIGVLPLVTAEGLLLLQLAAACLELLPLVGEGLLLVLPEDDGHAGGGDGPQLRHDEGHVLRRHRVVRQVQQRCSQGRHRSGFTNVRV